MENQRLISICDLDDMLIQSGRKSLPTDKAVCFHDGQPVSFMSKPQLALFTWLTQSTRLIPCTGRTVESFKTIELPFTDHAICSFGGVILDRQGAVIQAWNDHITACAAEHESELRRVHAQITDLLGRQHPELQIKLRQDAGNTLYLNIKDPLRRDDVIELLPWQLEGIVQEDRGWWMHMNGRNLAICPPFLGKDKAVAWFIENLAGEYDCVFGLGDSMSDLPFMGLANFALMPTQSQAFRCLKPAAPAHC